MSRCGDVFENRVTGEFADVVVFTSPPPGVQRVLFALLAPLARALGYKAIYPEYTKPHRRVTPDPRALKAAGLPPL